MKKGSLRQLIRNLRTGEAQKQAELFRGKPEPVFLAQLTPEQARELALKGEAFLRSYLGHGKKKKNKKKRA